MARHFVVVNEAVFNKALKKYHVAYDPEVDHTVKGQVIEDFWNKEHTEVRGCIRYFDDGTVQHQIRDDMVPYEEVLHELKPHLNDVPEIFQQTFFHPAPEQKDIPYWT